MKRSGWLLLVGLVAFGSTALAQPRVTVGEIKGKGGIMIRGAAVKALQAERSVTLISKDVIAGSARRMGVQLPKGRKEVSAALGIGAWVEGTLEREKKTLVANLAVIDAASGKTLGVMSYDAANVRALSKAVRSELFGDLGELIKSGKVPGKAKGDDEDEVAEADGEAPATAADAKPGKHGQRGPQRAETPSAEEAPEADEAAAATEEPAADLEEAPQVAQAAEQPEAEPAASESSGPGPSPFVLGVGLVGFTRDFVYEDDVVGLPQYDLGLGPSLGLNANWYPAAHFSTGAAANIGLDIRGQLAFGLDSQVSGSSSFPTSSSSFGIGVRGRLPLGTTELGAVVGYGNKRFSIGQVDKPAADGTAARNHPYVPSTSYSFLRVGADARFALSDKFTLGASLAYLPTFSTGVEEWFPRATAKGIEGEVRLGYAMSKSLDLNAGVGLQRFALAFNPSLEDARAGKPVAGGAVDQYLSFALGVGWHFQP